MPNNASNCTKRYQLTKETCKTIMIQNQTQKRVACYKLSMF